MGAILVGEWLEGLDPIEVLDEASLALVRARVLEVATTTGLGEAAAARLALAATELGTNQLRHAGNGAIAVRSVERLGTRGVELIAADSGPGIGDLAAAVRGRDAAAEPATAAAASLGVGFGSLFRNAGEVDVDTRIPQGTCLRLRTFAGPVTRSDCAVVGRALPGEHVSGDHAVVLRSPSRCTIALFDGLGHGPPARDAANAAAAAVRAHARAAPEAILAAAARALRGTRGAVGAVAAIDYERRTLEWAGAGNVSGVVCGGARSVQLVGAATILGAPGMTARVQTETTDFGPRHMFCAYTDGLTSRLVTHDDPSRLREHPVFLAQHLATTYARGTDDLLVVVAR